MKFLRSRLPKWLSPLALISCTSPRTESGVMQSLQSPAFFIAISPDHAPAEIRACGFCDWEKTRPVSEDMHLRIGSVTKLFIGNLILILRDEGWLAIDDPISRYLPDVPKGDRITLKQLAHHTSGLPDAIRSPAFREAIVSRPQRQWNAREILDHAFSQPAAFEPGASWQYCNTNTILLAVAAEKATGKSCAQLLEEKIFRPLGMQHTGFPEGGHLPAPACTGYKHGRKEMPIGYGTIRFEMSGYNASWTHAAGNLFSTISDLQRASRPLCEGTLLSEESRKILHDWQETGQPGYRYGFCIEAWNGFTGHRGDVPGYQAVIACKGATAYAVVANLSNTADGRSPANELMEFLASPARRPH